MQLPDFSVQGRVALITGAGRGIGLGIAKALAASGAAVAVQDIDEDVARAESDAINAAGGRAVALGGDIADLSLSEKLIEQTIEKLGGLDILINNASIQHFKPFLEHPLDEMRRQLDANVLAPTKLCQLAIPHMQAKKWGRIINFSSIQAKKGNSHAPAYAMSRASMENLTMGLAKEFGREGITVNCIAPGWYDTYRNRHDFKTPEEKEKRSNWMPIPRLGAAGDCAGITILLCSKAGEYITGQTIYVDGGMSIR